MHTLPVQNSTATPVQGAPTQDLPSTRGRFSPQYDFVLANRGAWCPFKFDTMPQARSFRNASLQMSTNTPSFRGLEAVMRKETIYLRLPAVTQ